MLREHLSASSDFFFLCFALLQVQANLKKAKASGAFSSLLSEQDNETHSANALFQRTHGKVGLMN